MHLSFKEAAKGAAKEIDVVEASGSTRSPRVEKKRYSVTIPAGIEDGQTLRISLSGRQVRYANQVNAPMVRILR